MRELGYRVVDMLVDQSPGAPLRRAAPAEMRERLGGAPPAGPRPFEEVLARLEHDVLPFRSRVDHPGFLAFIPGSGTWPGALADFIASACNVYAGSWMESAGPSQVELEVLGWFKDWVGYPPEAAGSLTSGGSAANMTALACAREAKAGPMRDDLVLYVSDQAHSSIARAARILGFRPEQVRVLPSDDAFRLAPGTLAAAMKADLARGLTPFAVAAQGGATNTGGGRPSPRARRALPRARRMAARGGGLRRLRSACRRGPPAGARAGGLGHARPAQVALPAVRVRLRAGTRRVDAEECLRDAARLPPRRE